MNPPQRQRKPGEPADLLEALAASVQRAQDARSAAEPAAEVDERSTAVPGVLTSYADVVQRTDEWWIVP